MPARKDMPSTLQRSPKKAQDTYVKAHDAAVEEYGEGERAHRTAFAAVKHSFEKVGDHWEPKSKKGPSDAKAAGGRDTKAKTAGGVDVRSLKGSLRPTVRMSTTPLSGRATRPPNRSRMTWATRRQVHRSLAKPAACAPSQSKSASACFSSMV